VFNPDIIGVTESWTDDKISDAEIPWAAPAGGAGGAAAPLCPGLAPRLPPQSEFCL